MNKVQIAGRIMDELFGHRSSPDPKYHEHTEKISEILTERESTLSGQVDALIQDRNRLQLRVSKLEQAGKNMLAKLQAMEGPINGCLAMAQVHGSFYEGPNWKMEFEQLKALLEDSK